MCKRVDLLRKSKNVARTEKRFFFFYLEPNRSKTENVRYAAVPVSSRPALDAPSLARYNIVLFTITYNP